MNRRAFLLASASALAYGCSSGSRSSPAPSTPPRTIPTPSVEPALPLPLRGLVTHSLDDWSLSIAHDLHARSLRHTIDFHYWHNPSYRAEIALGLANARGMGFDLLLVLHGQGGDLESFVEFVKEVHALAPHARLQIWNEPDALFPGSERFHADPIAFASHFAEVRESVPSAFLVGPGLAHLDSIPAWVQALDPLVDAHALHVYGFPMIGVWREKYVRARALTAKPIYCTEVGLEREVVPEGERAGWEIHQRDLLKECLEDRSGFERAYIHVLADGLDFGHSVTRPDRSLRPSAHWLHDHP